jgi:hypothetical protein
LIPGEVVVAAALSIELVWVSTSTMFILSQLQNALIGIWHSLISRPASENPEMKVPYCPQGIKI